MKLKIFIVLSEILGIIGILSLSGLFIIAAQNLGNGMYVLSIYEAMPLIYWVLFLFAGICGISRVLIDVFIIREGYRWIWGTAILVVISGLLISTPIYIDSAFHGQYDAVFHYSSAKEIFDIGSPNENNFYPMSHIWASSLAKISGITVRQAILYMPLIMYLIGLMNISVLAWVVDPRPEVRGLIVTMSILPVYSFYQVQFYPIQFSIYILWLFMGLFLHTKSKSSGITETILFILVLFVLPFLHPIGVISALVLLFSYLIFDLNQGLISAKNKRSMFSELVSKGFTPIILLFVSWFTWFSGFSVFGVSIRRLSNSIFLELSGRSFDDRYTAVVERSAGGIFDIIQLTAFIHGPNLAWGILLLFVILLMSLREGLFQKNTSFFLINISIFYLIGFLSLVIDIIASVPQRYINYAVAFVPIFAAPVIIRYFDLSSKIPKLIISSILFIILVGGFGFGTFNLYFSPLVRNASSQFTFAQFNGYQFLKNYNINEGGTYSPLRGTRSVFSLGSLTEVYELFEQSSNLSIRNAPAHFGYSDEPDNLGYEFNNQEYLIITSHEREVQRIGFQQARFSDEDYILLDNDYQWNKIYESGDFTLYSWREK